MHHHLILIVVVNFINCANIVVEGQLSANATIIIPRMPSYQII